MDKKLAIVIPAFKDIFFSKAIKSIVNQTDKNFTLYIGDDASPNDLYKIVKKYEDRIDIIYKKFNNNLGSTDLISHWKRCIEMVQDEEWIWLFSDDDIMAIDCVERINLNIHENPNFDLFHFNIIVINQFDDVVKNCNPFPEILTVPDFFFKRVKYKINSSLVEYVFKKSVYINENGFENYDLAWCSDDAAWIKFGRLKGILTIPDSVVKWRYSNSNISSNIMDKKLVLRKLQASINHIKWVKNYFFEKNIIDKTSNFDKYKWVISNLLISPSFSIKEKYNISLKVTNDLGYNKILILNSIYVLYWLIKENIYSIFNNFTIRSY